MSEITDDDHMIFLILVVQTQISRSKNEIYSCLVSIYLALGTS
jgi:hypothetical protein